MVTLGKDNIKAWLSVTKTTHNVVACLLAKRCNADSCIAHICYQRKITYSQDIQYAAVASGWCVCTQFTLIRTNKHGGEVGMPFYRNFNTPFCPCIIVIVVPGELMAHIHTYIYINIFISLLTEWCGPCLSLNCSSNSHNRLCNL